MIIKEAIKLHRVLFTTLNSITEIVSFMMRCIVSIFDSVGEFLTLMKPSFVMMGILSKGYIILTEALYFFRWELILLLKVCYQETKRSSEDVTFNKYKHYVMK